MHDMKRIREQTDVFIKALNSRGKDFTEDVTRLLALDAVRREKIGQAEALKAQQNAASKEIAQKKKKGEDASDLLAAMKNMAEQGKQWEAQRKEAEQALEALLLTLPNTPSSQTPTGQSEADNVPVRTWGTPPVFAFTPKPHWELGEALGILDPVRAAKVTGARFHFTKGTAARAERALANLFLDMHTKTGYTEIFPPFMVNRASMTGTGQLPKFEEDAFSVAGTDYFLVPTAEVPVTNLHREEILDGKALPIQYCAYSACFRAEAGSAGRDTRGIIRQHQFNKVELVTFARPENSYDELERLTAAAEAVLQALQLPYRVTALCSADLGFSGAKTYDLEVWMPSYERYVEISSCTNFEDFQARRAGIRFRDEEGLVRPVHTLNGSGVAIGRALAAIMENYQQKDGQILVPEALQPYMHCASF